MRKLCYFSSMSLLRTFYIASLLVALAYGEDMATLRFAQAAEFEKSGEWEKALAEYRAVLLDDPLNSQAYLKAGNVRLQQKNLHGALANFQLAVQHDPRMWPAREATARAYASLGQKEKAIAEWRKIADEGPAASKSKALAEIASLTGAQVETKAEKPSEGMDAKSSLGQDDTQSELYNKGLAYYSAGEWRKSLDVWRQLLAKQPGHAGAYYHAGVCRYNLGEFDKAEFNLKRSFAFPDRGFNAHYYLGRIYEKQNKIDAAKNAYQTYLEKTTSEQGKAEVQNRLATLQGKSGDAAKTVASDSSTIAEPIATATTPSSSVPEKIVEWTPGSLFAIASLQGPGGAELSKALHSLESKALNQGIETLKQVQVDYAGSPNAMAAMHNLTRLYNHLGLHDNAANMGIAALRSTPAEPWASAIRYQVAKALIEAGNPDAAAAQLDSVRGGGVLGPVESDRLALTAKSKAEKDAPQLLQRATEAEKDPVRKSSLLLQLAQLHLKQGNKAGAMKAWKEISDVCAEPETCRKAIVSLADINYQGRNWVMALEHYKRVIDSFPSSEDAPWSQFQMGNVHRKQKDFAEALRHFEAVSTQYPDSYWAEQAKLSREDVVWLEKGMGTTQGVKP